MSAVPHLLQRAKRWLQTHMTRVRITQLSELIDSIEDGIQSDHDEVTALRMDLAVERRRLRRLTTPTHQRREPTPCPLP